MSYSMNKRTESPDLPNDEGRLLERLDSMEAVDLANELEQLLDSMTEDTYDSELVTAYLDALDRKAPMPEFPNAITSFEAFRQKVYSSLGEPVTEHTDVPHKATPVRRLRRAPITAAAVIAVLLTILIGAHAAGINVFYSIVQWTEQSFHFVPDKSAEYHQMVQDAFEKIGVPGELAPTWYPEGFAADEPMIEYDSAKSCAYVLFSNDAGDSFLVQARHCDSSDLLEALEVEWSSPNAEMKLVGSFAFFVYTNEESSSAVWSDKRSNIVIVSGSISGDNLDAIIESIGGN